MDLLHLLAVFQWEGIVEYFADNYLIGLILVLFIIICCCCIHNKLISD